VDDVVLAGTHLEEISAVKHYLHKFFRIKDLGPLKYFLGIEVARSKIGILLNQRKYCLELIAEHGLTGCKPTSTPIDPSTKLLIDDGELHSDPTLYRRLIGRLLYLTNTRPNLSFIVQQLSQFVSAPRHPHMMVAMCIIRYLKGAPALGLFYPSKSDCRVQAFSDSDWATCPNTRRSVTGFCLFIGKALVSWRSKKQTTVSRSSSEAEYRALASLTCELQWLQYMAADLRISLPQPYSVFCGNQSAIHIAKNSSFHERTKHIEVDCHLIRIKLQEGLIHLFHVKSSSQLADLFTKALHARFFSDGITKLGLLNIHSPP
jgi:hypothetical protein